MQTISRKLQWPALLALGLATALTAQAEKSLTVNHSLPVQVKGTITTTGCQNSPGPTIVLDGQLLVGGISVQLVFQNNTKGTHKTTVTFSQETVLLPSGGAITLPKQPVQGGVGGNPHIWIQFHNGQGNDLSDEIYLGRCVQGLEISPSLLMEVLAQADVAALDCSNRPGPQISVGGSVTFLDGLKARFIFRNNLKGTHTAEETRDVELIAEGAQTTIPKQPSRGGAGGNPIISIQFLDDEGEIIDEPIVLGRCVQI